MLISALSFLTSYFTPALYFYVLFETIYQIDPDNTVVSIIAKVVSIAYVIILLVAIAGGLMGNIWTKYAHSVSACLTVFTFAMWGLVTYNIVAVYLSLNDKGIDWTNFSQMSILVMVGINLVGFFINIILHIFTHRDEVLRLLADQISYLAYQGAYSQTMVIHAFCNIDDVSWGTKGSSSSGGKKY
jgi:cellulose synthase/poly-beta-1,6-N-acetylglucosamine synthase-like glycosyltransferase